MKLNEQTQEQIDARVDAIWRKYCAPPSPESLAALERKRAALQADIDALDLQIAGERDCLDRRARRGG